MDAIQAIPGLILALAIVSVLTPNTTNAMLAIAMVIIPGNSRIVRGAVLAAKQNRYVEAAQAIGCRHPRIILTHILPNVTAPILVIASIWLGNAILIEASLSFLGVGTQPPTPSWGLMLSSTGRAFMEQAPWLAHLPRPRHQPGRPGLQSLRRHAARRVGSEAPRLRPMRALVSVILVVVLLPRCRPHPRGRPGQAGRRDALGALRDAGAGLVRSGRGGRRAHARSGCSTRCTTRS